MNKILGIALVAILASYPTVDAKYVPGFKLGVEFGASFNKYTEKGIKGQKLYGTDQAAANVKLVNGASTNDALAVDAKKSKTSFSGALTVGYEFLATDSIIVGADLGFGYNFAGKAKIYNTVDGKKDEDYGYTQFKKKFEVEFAPKIGFKMTDDFVGFFKVVANMTNYKLNAYNANTKQVTDGLNKSKTKFAFGLGTGLEYHFDNCLAATFGYTYLFKTKLLSDKKDTTTVIASNPSNPKTQVSTHKIAVGLKYTFA